MVISSAAAGFSHFNQINKSIKANCTKIYAAIQIRAIRSIKSATFGVVRRVKVIYNCIMIIQSLASGSKGNSVFIASENAKILVDVGLPWYLLEKRFVAAGIDPRTIEAIFITHEHGDHVCGLEGFVKRFKTRVYLQKDCVGVFPNLPNECVQIFDENVTVGDILVEYFPVPHDSKFCFGYTFRCGDEKIGLATDLGRVNSNIIAALSGSQIVFIESNHDLLRLTGNKKYPLVLKRRITSSVGHLSNPAASMAIYQLAKTGVSQFILAHLSEQNNSPTIAFECVRDFLAGQGIIEGRDVWIDVASQDKVGLRFSVKG